MKESIDKAIDELKEIIEQNGPDYLSGEPYRVYQRLEESEKVSKETAGLLLYALVSDIPSGVTPDTDFALLSKKIQTRCSLNKKAADFLSMVFLGLYSRENKENWKEKELEGLRQFLEDEFVCKWKGFAVWDEGNGTVDCYYQAEIRMTPTEDVAADKGLTELLEKNPFVKKEAISQYFEEALTDYLDSEFEDYCTADDYYQPVCEDFDAEDCVSEWCGKHGFELVSCDGGGGDGGYEPKYRRSWY